MLRQPDHSLLSTDVWVHLGVALKLSPRELQIVQGVFDDQKEEAIAAALGISSHTVNTHFQRLYRKLHVCSRPRLILRVIAEYFTCAAMSDATDRANLGRQYMLRAQAADECGTGPSVRGRAC